MKTLQKSALGFAIFATTLASVPAAAHGGHGRHKKQRHYPAQYQQPYHYAPAYGAQCDRGTGGLVVGAVVGGLVGNEFGKRGQKTLSTVVGSVAGAVVGKEIDKSNDPCRRR